MEGGNLMGIAQDLARNFSSPQVRQKSTRGRKSLLPQFRNEILQKFREGKSNQWIARWLVQSGRLVSVNQSTVARYRQQILGGKHV